LDSVTRRVIIGLIYEDGEGGGNTVSKQTDETSEFGKKLDTLRQERRWSWEDFAREASRFMPGEGSVSGVHLRNLAKGDRSEAGVSPELAAAIALALRVGLKDLSPVLVAKVKEARSLFDALNARRASHSLALTG
jgi:transcriptional regulator with XRE-family HTH domain